MQSNDSQIAFYAAKDIPPFLTLPVDSLNVPTSLPITSEKDRDTHKTVFSGLSQRQLGYPFDNIASDLSQKIQALDYHFGKTTVSNYSQGQKKVAVIICPSGAGKSKESVQIYSKVKDRWILVIEMWTTYELLTSRVLGDVISVYADNKMLMALPIEHINVPYQVRPRNLCEDVGTIL